MTMVAFQAGYETHEAFTRAFGVRFGCSPTAFRAKRGDARSCGDRRTTLPARSGIHFEADPTGPVRIHFLTGGFDMKTDIVDQPERRIAALRHTGAYHRIGETFGRLGGIAGPAGLFGPDTTMLAIYHDDPETTPEAELRSDAGLTIAEGRPLPDGLAEHRIPAGRYACATHVGPYEGLGDAWAEFMGQWLPESGHRVAEGVCFEIYKNDPMRTPKEALITEMYVPVA